MPSRALVLLFRYKYLLLLPFAIAIPAALIFVAISGDARYQAQAQFDVSRPSLLDDPRAADRNPYLSHAANEAGFVQEALRTNDFTDKVARRASFGFERPITRDDVRNGAWAAANGATLLTIGFTGADREVAARVVDAVAEEYAALVRERTLEELRLVDAIFTQQADEALAEASAAREELERVVEDLPPGTNPDFVPAVSELSSRADSFQATHTEALRGRSEARQLMRQVEDDGNLGFRMIDEPEVPAGALVRPKMEIFGPPALAFLLALTISAGLFAFLFKTDSTLRTLDDVTALPGVRTLGTVPDMDTPRAIPNIRGLARNIVSGGGARPAGGSGG